MKTGKRRLTAFAVVAATMLLALVGVVAPAWAEDSAAQPHLPVKDNKVTITSTLTMNENAVVPNATFNYSIAPADEESELTSTSGMPVYAGVTDAVTLSPTSVNFSNKGLTSTENTGEKTKTITAKLSAEIKPLCSRLRVSIDIKLRRRRQGWTVSTLHTRSSSWMFT